VADAGDDGVHVFAAVGHFELLCAAVGSQEPIKTWG
jgi:hypothetical protein